MNGLRERTQALALGALWALLMIIIVTIAVPVAMPIIIVQFVCRTISRAVRREPAPRLPESKVHLWSWEGPSPLEEIAAAIRSAAQVPVTVCTLDDGSIEIRTSDPDGQMVRITRTTDYDPDDGAGIIAGPWEYEGYSSSDYGLDDEAIAVAGAYLSGGLLRRRIGTEVVPILRYEPAGLWWRPSEGPRWFTQEWFRELPGQPVPSAQ